jgi:class 3 adenylate cyclase
MDGTATGQAGSLHDVFEDDAAQTWNSLVSLGRPLDGAMSGLQLATLNAALAGEVRRLRGQVARLLRLKRFVAPQISELVLSDDGATLLRSHERDIVVLFFDLRGFTPFVESAEPQRVIDTLHAYHRLIGRLAIDYQATVERYTGDGVMVFFNDPVVVNDPAQRAVRMALAARDGFREMRNTWTQPGAALGLGIGAAQGLATIGAIGSEDRSDYAAIGSVTNMAARLCAAARADQILICGRIAQATAGSVKSRQAGDGLLRGFLTPVPVFDVEGPA